MTDLPPTIFVLGTDRDIGKTVTCIGLISNLLGPDCGYRAEEIGYMKPVGQQVVQVPENGTVDLEILADKDAVLVTQLMGIQCERYGDMSPIVWERGLSESFIDGASEGDIAQARQQLVARIQDAYRRIARGKRIVLVEGTGQPGVGSVGGISNPDVIRILDEMGASVYVVLVAEGGIGSTIDRVFPYLMALDHLGTHVDGLIINNVLATKMTKVTRYVSTYYRTVFPSLYGHLIRDGKPPELLGFVPEIPELRLPTFRQVTDFLQSRTGAVETVTDTHWESDPAALPLVWNAKVISLDFGYEPYLSPGDVVIVGVNANDVILAMLLLHERMLRTQGKGLSGLILSCKQAGGLDTEVRELIRARSLPTITVELDSADIVQRLDNATWKVQPYDDLKRRLIAEAYREHLTLWPELRA